MNIERERQGVRGDVRPPEDVVGSLGYIPTIRGERLADGHTFLDTTEDYRWDGAFSGEATSTARVVVHASGAWSFRAVVSFHGNVGARGGGLEMSLWGSRPDGASDWQGTWVILSGTDELEGLHGQGTWGGPGWDQADPERPGPIDYAGQIQTVG